MQNDAPRGGVTEPNEFDEFRRRVARGERRRRILITVLDVLTALALLAIAALVIKMIFY
jgi:type IV secretory pathway component VirB8